MHNAKVMQVLKAVGNLIQNIREILLAPFCEFSMEMWLFNDIRQRRGTKLQGDVKKACALLLCKIPNY
jgi:hypothetical protein